MAPTPTTSTAPASSTEAVAPIRVANLADFEGAPLRMARVDGHRLCLVHLDGEVHALDNACPHQGYGLTQGQLDAERGLLTCAWHNWKFAVDDGTCVLGEEDVRTHDVTVDDAGEVYVTVRTPSPSEIRATTMPSLRRGIEKDYVGQISRDVVRLLQADANPGELIWEAVAHGAPRAEFGWGHSIASATDCLAMVDAHDGDHRALPLVQGIAGIAEVARDRPLQVLPEPSRDTARADTFRSQIEAEDVAAAQATIRRAIADDVERDELSRWFTGVVSDHHLSTGHAAIYSQKAFQLLDRLGWDRADTVLPHLVPTIVFGTRQDTLPYMRPFVRGLADVDLAELASVEPDPAWRDDGSLRRALLDADRHAPAPAVAAALAAGAGVDGVLDVIIDVVAERILRYDATNEFDPHDDFGWLAMTHGITYANAVRWHHERHPSPDTVRLAFWAAFQAFWTGRHEWHTGVGDRVDVEVPAAFAGDGPDVITAYGAAVQQRALTDEASTFIVHAHGIKTSVAATEEATRLGSRAPLDAVTRFLDEPRMERFVAANVTQAIDFLSGRVER